MDLTDAEKEKGAKAIDAMLSDGYEFAKNNRNFREEPGDVLHLFHFS